ncbi:MAG: FmdE family protein [Eubacteriaceae bacterium]|nr:FmdE family protein [Eubacteriaceae bacterium]
MNETEKKLWDECVAFHGHSCGGLTIGFKAAMYAMELMDIDRSGDEELVCIAENDSCGIDGIQYVCGCTVGKGNLLFRLRGKQAYDFYNRDSGESFRLILKEGKKSKEEMADMPGSELFDKMPVKFELPEKARIFRSYPCEKCGEMTADYFMREQDGKKVCLDCFERYDRFI